MTPKFLSGCGSAGVRTSEIGPASESAGPDFQPHGLPVGGHSPGARLRLCAGTHAALLGTRQCLFIICHVG